jgi:glyoxylase-like metal-dependent hydrolase (beta-lactamase superfamily II)
MSKVRSAVVAFLCLAPPCKVTAAASHPPIIQYYRLVPGFVAEEKNDAGFPAGPLGTGFAKDNPWGQYTAYLLATNAEGQRTWRIEHNLPKGDGTAQGSTMYLLEGSQRALLIDTANSAKFTPGINDLKTVVRHLLGHTNDGQVKSDPLDFVVANTHSHGDHVGENELMSDRTIYYMDLDWPPKDDASNYVPIREGGGPTKNGNGNAVSEIDLGDRVLKAIAMPPHTDGSTGYLDTRNLMLFTGDALGSSWPYVQKGPLTTYAATLRHVDVVTKPYPGIAVLPAHFYQTLAWGRRQKPLGRAYILDQEKNADGIISGKKVGEPFYSAGRNTYWARTGSAQTVYSLNTLYAPEETPAVAYHVVRIPGKFPAKWVKSAEVAKAASINANFYLIRGPGGESLFLLKGSKETLLIGTGSGAPGLAAVVTRLTGHTPLAVAISDDDPDQVSGLAQLHPHIVYGAAQIAHAVGAAAFRVLHDGETIDLGTDTAGRPLVLQANVLTGHSDAGFTFLETGDRLLFGGDAIGTQGGYLVLHDELKDFVAALTNWRKKTDGRYDIVYTAHNPQWYTSPTYIDELSEAAELGSAQGANGSVKSRGTPDVAATIRWMH